MRTRDRLRVVAGYCGAVLLGTFLVVPANLASVLVTTWITPPGDVEGSARTFMLCLLGSLALVGSAGGAVAARGSAPIPLAVLAGAAGPTLVVLVLVVSAAEEWGPGTVRDVALACLVPVGVALVGSGAGVALRRGVRRGASGLGFPDQGI